MTEIKHACEICGKEFKSNRGLLTHKRNIHDPSYASKLLNGYLKAKDKLLAAAVKRKEDRIEKYNESPKLCKQCNEPISYNKKKNMFCSSSCSCTYTNNLRTAEYHKSHSNRLKILYKMDPYKGCSKSFKICVHCGCEYLRLVGVNGAKYCSQSCGNEARSINLSKALKEKIKNGYNPQLHRNRTKSYLEDSFFNWLNTNHPTVYFIREYAIKSHDENGKYLKTFFGDFFFPELHLVIELDGTQHNKTIDYDKDRDQRILKEHGIYVYRISHNEYMKCQKLDIVNQLMLLAS